MTLDIEAKTIRIIELYCGIGGLAAASADLPAATEIAAAIDIDRLALGTYRANFPHPAHARTLESLRSSELERFEADLWWLSPPCQPFTRKGAGRDVDDPRAASLLALLDRIGEVRPPAVGFENVPGFAGSRAHRRLLEVLERGGYEVSEILLCPSELGVPNRRRRFYLVASRAGPLRPLERPAQGPTEPLAGYLDPDPDPELFLEPAFFERYRHALDRVEAADPEAVTACFTSGYGRSRVRSGSHLVTEDGRVRRFSPAEILRLLGFPESFRLPPELPRANAWRLVGNSLSLAPVRRVLGAVPGACTARP